MRHHLIGNKTNLFFCCSVVLLCFANSAPGQLTDKAPKEVGLCQGQFIATFKDKTTQEEKKLTPGEIERIETRLRKDLSSFFIEQIEESGI